MAFSGNGTGLSKESAFEITTLAELREINDYLDDDVNTAGNHDVHFKLMNDLDATFDTQDTAGAYYNGGAGWGPLGFSGSGSSGQFYGHLHFNGYKIIGLKIDRDSFRQGLFYQFGGDAYDVWLENFDINGQTSGVAGTFAGQLISGNGRGIHGFNASGSVSLTADFESSGGLIGQIIVTNTCVIENGISSVTVSNPNANAFPGGVVGRIFNTGPVIDKCIGVGPVTGDNAGKICANMATPADATNCFFLDPASGVAGGGAVGTIKSEAELKTLATYTNLATAGLAEVYDMVLVGDYLNETWAIDETVSYPQPGFEIENIPIPTMTVTDATGSPVQGAVVKFFTVDAFDSKAPNLSTATYIGTDYVTDANGVAEYDQGLAGNPNIDTTKVYGAIAFHAKNGAIEMQVIFGAKIGRQNIDLTLPA